MKKKKLISVLNNNNIYLNGDTRFYIFTQPNYGLGTNIIPSHRKDPDFTIESIEEPMDYNYFKMHQTASLKMRENFYMGGGLHIDWYSSIVDKNLDVANAVFTHHYDYSVLNKFDDKEYFVNGVSINFIYDSRDNQINTRKGWYANLNYRFNCALFNDQSASNILFSEFRYFLPLNPEKQNFILGFWTFGQFVTKGVVPYLNLPALGWDQRNRSGEGYTQGLFRGNNLIYFQTELRFPITCNQVLSGTAFANFTTASNKYDKINLFEYVQPAFGVGLRLLIDKATRTNLVFDYASGNHSNAFYINAGETF